MVHNHTIAMIWKRTRFEWKWALHFHINKRFIPVAEKRLLPICEYLKSTRSCTRGTTWISESTARQLLYSKGTEWERQENGTVIYSKTDGYFEHGREKVRDSSGAVGPRNKQEGSVYWPSWREAALFHDSACSVLSGNTNRKSQILLQLNKSYSV